MDHVLQWEEKWVQRAKGADRGRLVRDGASEDGVDGHRCSSIEI